MTDSLDQRLQTVLDKRSTLEAQKQRLEGQLEAAQKDLADVEAECRDRGVDPDKLDDAIEKIQTRYEELVVELESGVAAAEAALAPYLTKES